MPERSRPKPEPKRPPAEFGKKAIELAEQLGKTKRDLSKAAGRTGGARDQTIDRLAKGEGSLVFAYDVRRALASWGADITQLPPLDESEAAAAPPGAARMPEWMDEWRHLLEELHRLTTPERMTVELQRLRQLVEAHRRIEELDPRRQLETKRQP